MGICVSASKRVKNSLYKSPDFDSACDETFSHCLSLTQHAFPGVFPYQLTDAADHLFRVLAVSAAPPRALGWVSSPPTRSQVDSALRVLTRGPNDDDDGEAQTLSSAQFKDWAVELFSDAALSSSRGSLLRRVPIGAAGIAAVGALTRLGYGLIGAAIGVYALGAYAAVYLSL